MVWILKDGQSPTWQMNYGLQGVYVSKIDAINDYWNGIYGSEEMDEECTNEYVRFKNEILNYGFDSQTDIHLIEIGSVSGNIDLHATFYEPSEDTEDEHTIESFSSSEEESSEEESSEDIGVYLTDLTELPIVVEKGKEEEVDSDEEVDFGNLMIVEASEENSLEVSEKDSDDYKTGLMVEVPIVNSFELPPIVIPENHRTETIELIGGMDIYKVCVTQLWTGMRIEGYDHKIYLFLDHQKALDYAYNLAKEWRKEYREEDQEYREDGKYIFPDDSYSNWNEYSVEVIKSQLDFDNDILNTTEFGG